MITVLTSRTREREKKRKEERGAERQQKERGKPAEAGDGGPQDSAYVH